MGANLNEVNAARVANALESLELIIQSVDKDCVFDDQRGYRSKDNNEDTT